MQPQSNNPAMARWRTFLILGRVSNLPTVWSNCLAGWWLGGAGNVGKLPWLVIGMTCLYLGGMFLNDAFDADFDRQHRAERPIVSGAMSLEAVWRWGLAWLASGAFCLIWLGSLTGTLGVALLVCIVLYDALHKMIPAAPVLMGACRLLVYVIAASAGSTGVTGWAAWCGLALMAYVVGLSCLARHESAGGPSDYFSLVLLAVPIVLALIMNGGSYREAALLLSAVLALWIIRSLRPLFWSPEPDVKGAVSNLLAGIVFVDLLAVLDVPRAAGLVFLVCFAAALLARRYIPAT